MAVVESVFVKQGDHNVRLFFSVLADNVEIGNQDLKTYINETLLAGINANANKVDAIEKSLGDLLSTDNSISQVVNNIQKEVDVINKRDFANSIAPAKFTYDKTINALKLTFDK